MGGNVCSAVGIYHEFREELGWHQWGMGAVFSGAGNNHDSALNPPLGSLYPHMHHGSPSLYETFLTLHILSPSALKIACRIRDMPLLYALLLPGPTEHLPLYCTHIDVCQGISKETPQNSKLTKCYSNCNRANYDRRPWHKNISSH